MKLISGLESKTEIDEVWGRKMTTKFTVTVCLIIIAVVVKGERDENHEVGSKNRTISKSYNVTNPDRKISFRIIGNFFNGLDYAHVYTQINVDNIITCYNNIIKYLDMTQLQYAQQKQSPIVNYLDDSFTIIRKGLFRTQKDLTFISVATNSNFKPDFGKFPVYIDSNDHLTTNVTVTNRTRNARSAGWILGAFSIGLSLYDLSEVRDLKNKIEGLNKVDNLISAQLKQNTQVLNKLSDSVVKIGKGLSDLRKVSATNDFKINVSQLLFFIHITQQTISEWTNSIINILTHKKVDPKIFQSKDLEDALKDINSESKRKGYTLMSTLLTDILNEKVSFITEKGKIHFLLHLPLGRLPSLTLYELIQSPLFLSDNRVVKITTNKNLIAINNPITEKVELDYGDLKHCNRHKKSYVCSGHITNKIIDSSCLGAAFQSKSFTLPKICKFDLITSQELMFQTGSNKVIVYSLSKRGMKLFVTCPSEIPEQLTIFGFREITIRQDCILSSDHQIFKPEQSLHIHKYFVTEPLKGFNFSFEEIRKIKTEHEVYEKQKLSWNPEIDQQLKLNMLENHTTLIIIVVTTIIVLLIIVLLCITALYLYCRFRKFQSLLSDGKGVSTALAAGSPADDRMELAARLPKGEPGDDGDQQPAVVSSEADSISRAPRWAHNNTVLSRPPLRPSTNEARLEPHEINLLK